MTAGLLLGAHRIQRRCREQVPDQPEENPEEVAGEGDPQAPQDSLDDAPQPYRQVLQGFRTVAHTFSATYSSASSDIQRVIRRSLRESTNDDRTFIYSASNAIHHWVESVHPAMAGNETGKDGTEVGKDTKVTKDPTQLLADAREAGQDATDAVLDQIPEVERELPPGIPQDWCSLRLDHIPSSHWGSPAECSCSNLGLDPDPRCRSWTGRSIFQHYPADHLRPSGTRWMRWP